MGVALPIAIQTWNALDLFFFFFAQTHENGTSVIAESLPALMPSVFICCHGSAMTLMTS